MLIGSKRAFYWVKPTVWQFCCLDWRHWRVICCFRGWLLKMPPILIHKGWLVIWYGRWWCWWQDWFLPNGILMPCWFYCRRFCGCVLTPLWCWYKARFSLYQTWAGYLNGRLIRLVLCSYWRLSGSHYRCYGFWQSITLVMDWACPDYAGAFAVLSVWQKTCNLSRFFNLTPSNPWSLKRHFMPSLSFWPIC